MIKLTSFDLTALSFLYKTYPPAKGFCWFLDMSENLGKTAQAAFLRCKEKDAYSYVRRNLVSPATLVAIHHAKELKSADELFEINTTIQTACGLTYSEYFDTLCCNPKKFCSFLGYYSLSIHPEDHMAPENVEIS